MLGGKEGGQVSREETGGGQAAGRAAGAVLRAGKVQPSRPRIRGLPTRSQRGRAEAADREPAYLLTKSGT